ncbi:MAG: TlpA family protein disulfide reductase [Desulfobacterales bacterium]|nr:TlpA family protein disulfide reductase [Desulfobacterales bacterium]
MQRRYSWLLICAFLISLFFHASAAGAEPKIVVGTIDSAGIEMLIKANKGATVIVAMTAWCVPCREELPALVRLCNKYRSKGLKMVGITLDLNGPSAIQPILDKARVNFPVYWAGEEAAHDYNIFAIPMLMFVRDGKIIEKVAGWKSEGFLDQKIGSFLKKE